MAVIPESDFDVTESEDMTAELAAMGKGDEGDTAETKGGDAR